MAAEQRGLHLSRELRLHLGQHAGRQRVRCRQQMPRLGRPPKALFTAACGLLEGVLRYMSQHHLLDSNIHLASFDDHYLYDSLSLRIDTVQQDNRQLAWHCYDLLSQLIDGQAPEPLQRYLPATLQIRHP
ncbi:substrate-binding domain-containing protein [Klebsiella pneumoniae]|nr:substrate-binding domain-containing protein [Klebsiella pneumoniae]